MDETTATMPMQTPAPGRPRRRRLVLGCGCLAITLAALAGGGILFGGGVGSFFLSNRWKDRTQELLSQWTGGELFIGSISVRYGALVINDVELLAEDGLPCLTAETIRLPLTDPALLEAEEISLDNVAIEGLALSLRRDASGALSLPQRTLEMLRAPPDDLPALRADHIEISGLTAEIAPPASDEALPPLYTRVSLARVDHFNLEAKELGTPGLILSFGSISLREAQATAPSGARLAASAIEAIPAAPLSPGAPLEMRAIAASNVAVETSSGGLHASQILLDAPTWSQISTFGLLTLSDLSLDASDERWSVDRVRIDPGGPWVGRELPIGRVTLAGSSAAVPQRWRGLLSVAEQLAADPMIPWPPTRIDQLTLSGGFPIGRATLRDVRAEQLSITRSELRWARIQTGAFVTGPALGIEHVSLSSGDWLLSGAPRITEAEISGVRGTLDPYAPWLGLPSDIVALLPSGLSITKARARDINATVALSTRSGTLKADSALASDTVLQPTAWTSRETSASTLELTIHSSSGDLVFEADLLDLGSATLAEHPVIPRISATAIDIRSSDEIVAGADRILFEGTTLNIEGGDWWTSLPSGHALTIPSVAREYVPVALGGAQGSHRPWWGIDLTGLPISLHRAVGSTKLHLEDRPFEKTLEIELTPWSLGPSGDVTPFSAEGKLAKGRLQLKGTAHPDGKVSLSLDAQDIEAETFDPYMRDVLAPAGLALSDGKIDLDLEIALTPIHIKITGRATVRKAQLSIEDKNAFTLTGLPSPPNTLPERIISIDTLCKLDDDPCSPLRQLYVPVAADLLMALQF